jgi:hypothetical protein
MVLATPATALDALSTPVPRKARWYDAYPNVKLAVQFLQVSPKAGLEASAMGGSLARQRRLNDGCSPWVDYLATLQYQPEPRRVRLAHQWAQQVLASL